MLNGAAFCFFRLVCQAFSVNPIATTPTIIFNNASETHDAINEAIITPMIAAGMLERTAFMSHFRQNFCTVKISITQRMGSMIAAAVIGDVVKEIKGTAMMPNAPEKPPFEMPVIKTAIAIIRLCTRSIYVPVR